LTTRFNGYTISVILSISNKALEYAFLERLQQLQNQVVWPSVLEMEPRTYIPDVGVIRHLQLFSTLYSNTF
jgi:hypothetical protein